MNDNDGWHRPTSRRTHVDARVRAPQRDSRAVHRVVRDDQSRARHGLARALAVHRDRPLAARHERVDSSAHGTRDARDGGGRAFSAMTMSRRSRRRARRRVRPKRRRDVDRASRRPRRQRVSHDAGGGGGGASARDEYGCPHLLMRISARSRSVLGWGVYVLPGVFCPAGRRERAVSSTYMIYIT
eukprot:30843-Pelagococcus_subviridis.AAC.2